MAQPRGILRYLALCGALAQAPVSRGEEGARTDIAIGEGPEREVRFASGGTVYVEALVEGRWIGRSWSARGGREASTWRRPVPAFQIVVREEPAAKETALETGWQWVSASEVNEAGRGGRHFQIELSHRIRPITVKLHTHLDGTAVLTRWLEITSAAARPLALTALAPWSGRLWEEDGPVVLGCSVIQSDQQTGSFGWRALAAGSTAIQNTREPCYDDPYFMLRHEARGEYFFGQLAWPSLHRMEFVKEGGLTFTIGPLASAGALRILSPGETIETPAVHLCHLRGDFDAVVQEMHGHVRRSVLPARRPELSQRIEYIANGDTGACLYKGDDFNEQNLRPCVDVAAAVGAEVFLIDGPFWAEKKERAAEDDDWDGFNWLEASKKLFPGGLRALGDHARRQGLLFGAYARTEGRGLLGSGAPDMFEAASGTIEAHRLDLYRHDTSSNQWRDWVHVRTRDRFEECILWRHHEAFYRAARRLRQKHPGVILQQAAGGGARSDLATAAHWQESFQSDLTPAPLVYRMMAGFSVYLPPEAMQSAYHGMWVATLPDRTTLLRCIFALGNVPCIYWTQLPGKVEAIPPEDLQQWRKYTGLYKRFIRPLASTCRVYHHAPINDREGWDSGAWLAMEFVSPDRSKGWALAVKYPGERASTYSFRPRGLDGEKRYRIVFDNPGRSELHAGSDLMRAGLTLGLPAETSSELLLIEAVE